MMQYDAMHTSVLVAVQLSVSADTSNDYEVNGSV
jgi:hypothetical protein